MINFERELTDEKVLAERMPFMSTENLKFKERDMIVEILKYWSKSEKHLSASQMTQLWYLIKLMQNLIKSKIVIIIKQLFSSGMEESVDI